jgi:hypothetical protein
MHDDASKNSVHSIISIQPGSDENCHSPSIQYETVARHQQYDSIVVTGYEQLTAQYEAVHNNTLEPIGEVTTQVNQIEGRPIADHWVNNIDEDGYWLVHEDQATQVTHA